MAKTVGLGIQGIQGTRSLVMFLRVLATSILENRKCPLCESKLQRDSVFAHHIAFRHLAKPLNYILPLLIDGDDNLLSVGTELKRLYASSCSTTLVIACISSQLIFVSLTSKQLTFNFQLCIDHHDQEEEPGESDNIP